MKRGGLILLLGLVLGGAAFAGFYYLGTAHCRQMLREPQPELAWLKQEFNLSEAEFSRVVKLHEAYLPQCAERCAIIEEQSQKLRELLRDPKAVTPEMEALLLERARVRAVCETEMLRHFLQVRQTMPREQGERYLAWVLDQTLFSSQAMEQRHRSSAQAESGHAGHSSHH